MRSCSTEEIPNQKFIAETVTLQRGENGTAGPHDPRRARWRRPPEDGLGDTVKPRLQEAGADLDRVLVIDDGDQPLTLSDERLEKGHLSKRCQTAHYRPGASVSGG